MPRKLPDAPLNLDKPLLSAVEAAAFLLIDVHTLDCWRSSKNPFIPYLKIGGKIAYRKADLEKWLESRYVGA